MKPIYLITTLIAIFAFHPQPAFAQLRTLQAAKLEKAKLDKAAGNETKKTGVILKAGDGSGYVTLSLAAVQFSNMLKAMIEDSGPDMAFKEPIPTGESKGEALAAIGTMLTALATESKPATFIKNELTRKPSNQVSDILILANFLEIAPVLNIAINVYGDKIFVGDLQGLYWTEIENDWKHYAAYKKETFGLVPPEIQQLVISEKLRSIDRVFLSNTPDRRLDAVKGLDLATAQIVAYIDKENVRSAEALPAFMQKELEARGLIEKHTKDSIRSGFQRWMGWKEGLVYESKIHFGPMPIEFATWPSHCPLQSNKDYNMYSDGTPDDRYIDNGDGTVTDRCTKLIWEKTAAKSEFPLQKAKEDCAKLNNKDVKDWRVPTLIELQSIVNYEATNPASNGIFAGNQSFWSSTSAWTIEFHTGRITLAFVGNENHRVRCVRGENGGPQSLGAKNHYARDEKAATVTDNFTGAVWQRHLDIEPRNNAKAQDYCKNLVLEGQRWLLPTVKQLFTLQDLGVEKRIDTAAFPNTPSNLFWSRTSRSSLGVGSSWVVSFKQGGLSYFSSDSTINQARCVR